MNDIEKIFKNADFSAGSDHKKRLHDMLFCENSSLKTISFPDNVLDDDELDKAAGGVQVQYDPKASRIPMTCKKCGQELTEDKIVNGRCAYCFYPVDE